jgi:ABC-type glycerol-3-phosphate transport system substrate-binding protein
LSVAIVVDLTMNIKRTMPLRSIFALALVLLSITAISCGGGAEDGKTVVTFWHFWSEPTQKQALLDRVTAFEAANPGVTVQLSELSWADGKTKLLAAFNSNTAPDVLELGSDWVAQFSSAGVLADQSALDSNGMPNVADEFLAPGMWEQKLYARPWIVDTRVLFVNTGLLAEAGVDTNDLGTTWDDVLDRAEKVYAYGNNMVGFAANGPDEHRLYKKIVPFFWSNGGDILDADGKPVINSPENIEALEMYQALMRTGLFDTQKQLDQMFINGSVAYWYSGGWLVDRIASDNPNLVYRVVTLPQFDDKPSVSFGGGEYLAINSRSEHPDIAMRLVNFLASGEQALAFCKQLPGMPIPADRAAPVDAESQSPLRAVFAQQLKQARMTPVHPQWLDIESIIEEEVSQAILAQKSAEQALNDAQFRLNELLNDGEPMASR